MTYENNTKYIAEAWVDNEKEREFIKSFLNSLIKEWQGHENGFDADTVDGLHGDDIRVLIETATKDLIDSFQIGLTNFNNQKELYYLGFEAIKLYNPDVVEEDNAGYLDEEKKLPWGTEPIIDAKDIPNLLETFRQLYDLTYFGEEGSGVENRTLYENFKTEVSNIEERLETLEEGLDGKIVNGLLDADSVNGIRFFILTPEQYADLKESASQYVEGGENTQQVINDYQKFTSLHNFFIIKSEEEIIAGGYEDGIYPNNPDVAIIDKYYKFRIEEVTTYDEELEESITKLWLQYQHPDSDEWHNMCPAANFIDEKMVETYVLRILGSNTNYVLNPDAVRSALNRINVDDSSTLPFAVYNRNTYIKGGIYDYRGGDSNNKTDIPIQFFNGFQYLDLTSFSDEILQVISDYKDRLEGADGNGGIIGDIRANISQLNNEISAIKGGSDESINSLNVRLQTLEQNVNCLLAASKGLDRWITEDITYWDGGIKTLQHVDSNGTHKSYVEWNEKTGVVYLNLYFTMYLGSENINNQEAKPIRLDKNTSIDVYVPIQPPFVQGYAASTNNPLDMVKINTNGKILVKSLRTVLPKGNKVPISVSFAYKVNDRPSGCGN